MSFNRSPASRPTHKVKEMSWFRSSGIIVVKQSVVSSSSVLSISQWWLVWTASERRLPKNGIWLFGAFENMYWISEVDIISSALCMLKASSLTPPYFLNFSISMPLNHGLCRRSAQSPKRCSISQNRYRSMIWLKGTCSFILRQLLNFERFIGLSKRCACVFDTPTSFPSC